MSSFGSAVIKDISAGGDGTTIFFLALDQSGYVWSWGNNGSAIYGIYAGTTPQIVNSLTNISAISAGVNQGVALTSSGNVYNWGTISRQNDEKYLTPMLVIGASPASAIDAGDNYNVAKRTDGSVFAWGHLLDGTVPGITSPSAISAGAETYYNPMFLKSDGTLVKTSFSMIDGTPQIVETVTELSSYRFTMFDVSSRAFFVTTDGKLLIQSSTGTTPYILNSPLQ
jgi:alpha-tubulin suppressor-like RCC1 family protein